jgi:two-component system sensor histidine kinase/response regulator
LRKTTRSIACARKLLQKQGHSVTSMNRGREDLQLWEQNQSRRFDVILLDVQMPERDGLRAPALIREKELASDAQIPIIAVTAPATKRDCERSVAAGLDGYITKPINPGELAEPIQAAFRNGTRLPAAHADPIQVGPSDAQLLARFDGDLSKEFAGIFLQECPRMLDDICEALRTGNAKALEPAAPVLKGSAGNFAMRVRGKPRSAWNGWQSPGDFPVPKIFCKRSNRKSSCSIRF